MKIRSSKKHKLSGRPKSNLQSLTAAALILPGLLQPAMTYAADEDEVDFQYSHYQEGKRDIYIDQAFALDAPGLITKAPNVLNPIEVDSLNGKARVSLTDRVKFAFNYTQDTWGGATPIATAPAMSGAMGATYKSGGRDTIIGASPYLNPAQESHNYFFINRQGNILAANNTGKTDPNGFPIYAPGINNNQLTHVLGSASPETRQQGDFKLNYAFDNASLSAGGGVSVERDYDSRFGNLGIGLDFNEKRTNVNWGLSYTNSDTHATMDPTSNGFWTSLGPYAAENGAVITGTQPTIQSYSPLTQGTRIIEPVVFNGVAVNNTYVRGNRQDWGSTLGLTQVLTKNAELELGVGYTHSAGYLTNPYKGVFVFNSIPTPSQDPNQPLLFSGGGQYESRPHERNQLNANLGYHYYLEALDAGLHGGYKVFHDDWGITSHTFDGDWVQPLGAGWTVTPNVRYYSQSAANFYAPYFTTVQMQGVDADGNPININSPLNKALPNYYSSDQRLSGFGTISGGVTVTKQFAKGIQLQTGFDYYSHQGGLKLGGGGEQAFADFDYWTANAALKINLGALNFHGGSTSGDAAHHAAHAILNPAGVMFDHALAKAGDFMFGYRFQRSEQAGDVLNGSAAVSPDQVTEAGCAPYKCMMAPASMVMNMHMLDLMAAPTDWLTVMLMPQWMDTTMDMHHLAGHAHSGHSHSGGLMEISSHQTGGVGDTGLYALFKLFEQPGHHLVLSLGGTAPTGAVNNMQRRNTSKGGYETPLDYSMQLGSGTWDLKPSLTYSGALQDFSWGAQATGTKRLENHNSAGYALGDIFQSSIWGGYHWTNWLSTTVRGIYTWQGQIKGGYLPLVADDGSNISYNDMLSGMATPSDLTANYGGRFVDLGLGVSVTVPGGTFAGNTIKFEWLQPVHTDYNGYQLDRSGALTATWAVGF